ncbi:MAG: hypothetical protein H6Q39_987 [Chloroflexi bacterium]|nr:hypothetical protein [Chloroflexota bacterium]
MAQTKYGNLVFKHTLVPNKFTDQRILFSGERDFKSDFSTIIVAVDRPMLMEDVPHKHDFDIYLTFIGFNPNGLHDLGAEIELFMGEEQEKFIITSPTTIYIPKGFVHCPLRFVKVERPLLLVHSSLAPEYKK